MVLVEEIGELQEVRRGRSLFLRKVVVGPPHTKPCLKVVALHGTCATQTQYQPFLEALDDLLVQANNDNNKTSCIIIWLYDNVGCGQSPAMTEWDDYSNENFALDLRAILVDQVLKQDGPLSCVLMGHSYSPTILLELLNRCSPIPDLLKPDAFIFVSSAIRSDNDSKGLLMPDGGHPIMRLPVFILSCLQWHLSESFLGLGLCKDCDPALRDKLRSENNGNNMAMAQATHRNHKWATSDDAKVLHHVPTLVIHGTEDGIISPQCSELIAKELPMSKLVLIEKASHLIMLEQPVEMASNLLSFLKQNDLIKEDQRSKLLQSNIVH
jgi:pimeloyl-ACP methyl ester carboxylesterase